MTHEPISKHVSQNATLIRVLLHRLNLPRVSDCKPKASPAWTMGGKPAASSTSNHDGPGPGEHTWELPAGTPAFSISGKARSPTPNAAAPAPGPGMYCTNAAAGSGAPAFTMLGRLPDPSAAAAAALPGPGRYNPELKPEGPAFTISGRTKNVGPAAGADAPGPGQYEPSHFIGRDGPAYSIRLRPAKAAAGGGGDVGPGDYTLPDGAWRRGPAFTTAGRHTTGPDKGAATPGTWRGRGVTITCHVTCTVSVSMPACHLVDSCFVSMSAYYSILCTVWRPVSAATSLPTTAGLALHTVRASFTIWRWYIELH